jgi:hypothetical protein
MAAGISARLTVGEGRRFAFTVGAAFLVLAALSRWRGHPAAPIVLGALGTLLLAAGMLAPGRLGPAYRAWMGLALAVSKVTTPILLGVVYFGVLTPTGILMRLFGRRPLPATAQGASVWVRRAGAASDLRHQF